MTDFSTTEYWKAINLYGLNNATYKVCLGKSLLDFFQKVASQITWQELSKSFLDHYVARLNAESAMPQQSNPVRLTVMERVISDLRHGKLMYHAAVDRVGSEGLNDVVPRFQSIGTNKVLVKDKFYEFHFGKRLILKDTLFHIGEEGISDLNAVEESISECGSVESEAEQYLVGYFPHLSIHVSVGSYCNIVYLLLIYKDQDVSHSYSLFTRWS